MQSRFCERCGGADEGTRTTPSLGRHLDGNTPAVGVEFGRVEAADFGGAGLIGAGMLDADAGFKDVGAGRQAVEEEVALALPGARMMRSARALTPSAHA